MTRELPLDDIPRHFMDDACLRCSRLYDHGENCVVVRGGPNARYRLVGLLVCRACVYPPTDQLDEPLAQSFYVAGPGTRVRTWPRYIGLTGIEGYVKLARLANGVYRVGLHRGHAEVWSAAEIDAHGRPRPGQAPMEYSRDYQCYATPGLLARGIPEVERRFVDLRFPAVPRSAP
jgi:hypothetical protein